MSALAIEISHTGFTSESTATRASAQAAVTSHPRGRGFEILSRMARIQADQDEPAYTPRHLNAPLHLSAV